MYNKNFEEHTHKTKHKESQNQISEYTRKRPISQKYMRQTI